MGTMAVRNVRRTKTSRGSASSSTRGLKIQDSYKPLSEVEQAKQHWKEDSRALRNASAKSLAEFVRGSVRKPRSDGHAYSADQVDRFIALLRCKPRPSAQSVLREMDILACLVGLLLKVEPTSRPSDRVKDIESGVVGPSKA